VDVKACALLFLLASSAYSMGGIMESNSFEYEPRKSEKPKPATAPVVRMDTTITMTISGGDTTKTVTIRRLENASAVVDNQAQIAESYKQSVDTQRSLAGFYVVMSVISILVILLI
jgi:hypothetical protein